MLAIEIGPASYVETEAVKFGRIYPLFVGAGHAVVIRFSMKGPLA